MIFDLSGDSREIFSRSLDSKVTEDAVKKAKAAVKVAVLARSDNGDEVR